MLALLESVCVPKESIITRIIKRVRCEPGITARRIRVFGAPVLNILMNIEQDIKPRALAKKLRAAEREIGGTGNVSVCFARGFAYSQYFKERGYLEQDLRSVYEALAYKAAEILPCEVNTVYFTASRMNTAAQNTLRVLCGRFRHVLADVKTGGSDFFAKMQRSLGISVVEQPAPVQILQADAAFFLHTGKREDAVVLSDDCVVYAVSQEALSYVQCKKLVAGFDIEVEHGGECDICEAFPKEPLIANALENMTLTTDNLVLRDVRVSDVQVYA